MINCAHCTHCHFHTDAIQCDAGVMDIRIIGKVYVGEITQDKCDLYEQTKTSMIIDRVIEQVEADAKRRGRPRKGQGQ